MWRPKFAKPANALLVGGALFVLGAACLYDAWDGRGNRPPLLVRPFLPW